MATPIRTRQQPFPPAPIVDIERMPLLYEDDEEGDMGESNLHEVTNGIVRTGLEAHLAGQAQYRVFSNLNLYYSPRDPKAYVSPDAMIVVPFNPLGPTRNHTVLAKKDRLRFSPPRFFPNDQLNKETCKRR